MNDSDICKIPFTTVQIYNWGRGFEIFTCCPVSVYNKPIGKGDDLKNFDKIWNSDKAKIFRKKLTHKDYSFCNTDFCNNHINLNLPIIDFLQENKIPVNYNEVEDYPIVVKFSHDRECNLHCATCRDKIFVNSEEELKSFNDKIDTELIPILKNAKVVYLSGDGDPFASRHYRSLIKKINETYPNIKYILHTNAILFNEKNIKDLEIENKIYAAGISIHAATKETYEKTMCGAKWDTLHKNLQYISELKKTGKIKNIYFYFVIQKNNYKEMVDFVKMAQKYNAVVRFTRYVNWGNEFGKDYDELAIFNPENKEFENYVRYLQNPIFKSENCKLDPISDKYINLKNIELFLLKNRIFKISHKIKTSGIFIRNIGIKAIPNKKLRKKLREKYNLY